VPASLHHASSKDPESTSIGVLLISSLGLYLYTEGFWAGWSFYLQIISSKWLWSPFKKVSKPRGRAILDEKCSKNASRNGPRSPQNPPAPFLSILVWPSLMSQDTQYSNDSDMHVNRRCPSSPSMQSFGRVAQGGHVSARARNRYPLAVIMAQSLRSPSCLGQALYIPLPDSRVMSQTPLSSRMCRDAPAAGGKVQEGHCQ